MRLIQLKIILQVWNIVYVFGNGDQNRVKEAQQLEKQVGKNCNDRNRTHAHFFSFQSHRDLSDIAARVESCLPSNTN